MDRAQKPGVLVVRDAEEQPAQLDGGRQFAIPLIGGTDRGGPSRRPSGKLPLPISASANPGTKATIV
jgi:hypothetical protein